MTDAPSSVSVVTADEIARYGYQTLEDILGGVRGVYVTNDVEYSYLGVRGMSRSGDYSGLVLVLIDGHRMNEPLYDQPALGHFFPVDIELIERVEVIRGPTSSLYGTNAFHAVVNVITKRGRDLDGVHLGLGAITNGAWRGRLAGGARIGSELEVAASGSFFLDPGSTLKLGRFGAVEDLNDEQAWNASLKLAWRQLTLITAAGDSRRGVPTGAYGTVIGSDRTWADDLYYFADLRWADHWERLDVEARLFVDHYHYRGNFDFDYGEEGDPWRVINHDRSHSDALGAQLQGNVQAADTLRLSMGAEIKHAFSVGQHNYDVEVYLDDERSTTFGGLFTQAEWQIVPVLTLNAAVRLDGYDTFGWELSPRAAVLLRPGDDTTFKLLFGRAYRAPNQYELHYQDGASAKPAGTLDPEHIQSYEIVWEQRIAAPLRAVVSAFRWQMRDLITYVEDPADGRLTFVNRDAADAWGIEAQLDASWFDGPAGALSWSFVDARDADGVWLDNSPRHQLKLQLGVPLVDRRLVAGLQCILTSPRKTIAGDDTGWVPVVDLTLSSRDLVDGLELGLTAHNLFDFRYGAPASEELELDTIPQPGLRVSLSASYRF